MKKFGFLFSVATFLLSVIFSAIPVNVYAQTSTYICPEGYTCTPIVPPPTSIICPVGYTCTSIVPPSNPGGGGGGGGTSISSHGGYNQLGIDSSISGSGNLISANEDKAYKWNNGRVYASDWKWSIDIFNSSHEEKTIKRMILVHNTRGEGWATDASANNPIGISLYLLATASDPCGTDCIPFNIYSDNIGMKIPANSQKFIYMYGANIYASQVFTGGRLIIEFTNGKSAEINIPASSIVPTNTSVPLPVPIPNPVPVPLPVPTPCYTFSTNLQLGSSGADVVALQTFLVSNGFKIEDLETRGSSQKGYFGRSTFLALKKYQTSVGISATGYFGPLTRASVNADICSVNPVPVPDPVPVPAKFIIVLSPNGGEEYVAGNNYEIRWNAVNLRANAKVYLELRPDFESVSPGIKIDSVPAGKGSYFWKIPSNIALGKYRIEIYSADENGIIDGLAKSVSKSSFTISSVVGTNPTITNISPSSGTSGTRVTIYGNNFKKGNYVRVSGKSFEQSIIPEQSSVTSLVFTMPVLPERKGPYDVQVGYEDTLSNFAQFAIESRTQPQFTVTTPRGGENFAVGDSMRVEWKDNRNVSMKNVGLILRKVDTAPNFPQDSGNQAVLVPNTGSYTWTIGDMGETGQYILRITCDPASACPMADSAVFTVGSRSAGPIISNVSGKAAGNGEIDAGGSVGIQGTNLIGNRKKETSVYIGASACQITQISDSFIYCTAATNLNVGSTYDLYVKNSGGVSNAVQVKILSSITPTFQSISWMKEISSGNIYYNPRVNFGSGDVLPFHDDSTATKWCQAVPGMNYSSGASTIQGANPQTGVHNRWDGSKWVAHDSGDYPRLYTCYNAETRIPTTSITGAIWNAVSEYLNKTGGR